VDNIIDENVGNKWTRSGIIYENLCLEVLTNMSREVEGPFEPGLYGLTFSHIISYGITFILKGSCMFALVMIFAAASRASFKICPCYKKQKPCATMPKSTCQETTGQKTEYYSVV
jgi:hypothetical protein